MKHFERVENYVQIAVDEVDTMAGWFNPVMTDSLWLQQ